MMTIKEIITNELDKITEKYGIKSFITGISHTKEIIMQHANRYDELYSKIKADLFIQDMHEDDNCNTIFYVLKHHVLTISGYGVVFVIKLWEKSCDIIIWPQKTVYDEKEIEVNSGTAAFTMKLDFKDIDKDAYAIAMESDDKLNELYQIYISSEQRDDLSQMVRYVFQDIFEKLKITQDESKQKEDALKEIITLMDTYGVTYIEYSQHLIIEIVFSVNEYCLNALKELLESKDAVKEVSFQIGSYDVMMSNHQTVIICVNHTVLTLSFYDRSPQLYDMIAYYCDFNRKSEEVVTKSDSTKRVTIPIKRVTVPGVNDIDEFAKEIETLSCKPESELADVIRSIIWMLKN